MMRLAGIQSIAAAALLLALASGVAPAQTARSGGSQSSQLVQQMQQLAEERTSLQAELARTKKELEGLRKERDDLKKGQEAVDQRARAATAALAQGVGQRTATEQELTQTKARMQELVAKFRETLATMRQIETEGAATRQALTQREQQLKVCTEHNDALYRLNGEILTNWEHEGTWSRLARSEPFTRIKRTELENMVDDYHERAEALKVKPVPPAAPVGAPAAAPPTVGSDAGH